MFTVIICEKSIIDDCTSKYKIHFTPLLNNKEIAFCSWYPEATTLEEAVPELNELIKSRQDWRAVVVHDRHVIADDLIYKPNPFDFVGTEKYPMHLTNREGILRYREYINRTSQKAVENPLMRLSVWLNGYTTRLRPDVVAEDIITDVEPFSEEYNEVLRKEEISVVDLETSLARAYRFDVVNSKFLIDGELFCPPKVVIAISERAKNIELIEAEAAWRDHKEYDYSKYAEDNLYSSKMRCLVYQIPRIKGNIRELDYFKFLSTLLIFSENDVSYDMFKLGRVYELSSEIDNEKVKKLCNDYLYKLKETLKKISILRRRRKLTESRKVDDSVAKKDYESDVTVPVRMPEGYNKDSLMCQYREIGFSTDCPGSESIYWKNQHTDIRKHFVRFLRQPHRSIKNAVEHEFVQTNSIDDYRAKQLTEFQLEDIVFRLQEEEQNMVETSTSKIFDKKKYNEMLDEADREVKREIAQRMTQKKTICLGAILLVLSVFGFVPLVISEFNNLGTGAMSFALLLITLGVICAGMFSSLFMLRNKLINRFRHFNHVMGGIYDEILGSMDTFSVYLSHACNVMREFSIIDIINSKIDVYSNIYRKHEIEIDRCMKNVIRLFPEYIEENYTPKEAIDAYDFDFDQPCSYNYEIPYSTVTNDVEFLHKGSKVAVPVDYIKCITLKREELYD